MIRQKIGALLCVVACVLGCVSPYDVSYDLNSNVITVEGFITDQTGATVTIKRSISQNRSSYAVPMKGCLVEIWVGNSTTIALQETSEGIYTTPADFVAQSGQSYQLHFKTSEGKTYKSSLEKMVAVPSIKKIYQQYDPKGLLDNTGSRVLGSSINIFLDLDDPAAERNFYLWRWTLWERQSVCITCVEGTYNGRECIKVFSNPVAPTYDYNCKTACWEVFRSNDLNVFSDVYSNGRSVIGRPIGKIPFYSTLGALIEIEQLGIGAAAYDYYQLLRSQNQTTGTLADTPPAPIIGNIKNVDDADEKIVGYFGAATVKKMRYWVDRSGYENIKLTPMLGREPNFELPNPFPPPAAPCVLGRNRTPFLPEGWQK